MDCTWWHQAIARTNFDITSNGVLLHSPQNNFTRSPQEFNIYHGFRDYTTISPRGQWVKSEAGSFMWEGYNIHQPKWLTNHQPIAFHTKLPQSLKLDIFHFNGHIYFQTPASLIDPQIIPNIIWYSHGHIHIPSKLAPMKCTFALPIIYLSSYKTTQTFISMYLVAPPTTAWH